MTGSRKALIGVAIVLFLGLTIYLNIRYARQGGLEVTAEKAQPRDLQAVVTASGTIQPIRSVDVGAYSPGKVVDLKVKEGDEVKEGEFLLQIDPRSMQIQADSQEQALETARSQLEETRNALANAKAALAQAKVTFERQADLFTHHLIGKQDYDTAQNNLDMQQATVDQTTQSLKTQDTRIAQAVSMLENAKYNLDLMRITSPIAGVVTKRSVELGQMVTGSEFAPSVLVTVADMSVIRAEVEVDETDIPNVKPGQPATVTIDAMPDQTYKGEVEELGDSAIVATGAAASARATDFKVKVQLDHTIPGIKPGFTCSASITTATRHQVLSVPIQSVTVREVVVDQTGTMVKPDAGRAGQRRTAAATPQELLPGQSRKELEGVFVIRDGKAIFTPTKIGIAGDKYFEVLAGVQAGDEIITGPFASVRSMKDGDAVKISTSTTASTSAPTTAKLP